jgi:hypothetical protein
MHGGEVRRTFRGARKPSAAWLSKPWPVRRKSADSAPCGDRHTRKALSKALIDNLVERGLDPAVARLFIIDGAKALPKAIRRTFGRHMPIQRCQIHKARNLMERLPPSLHASVRHVLRQTRVV